jgi:hypothetical protein
MFLHVYKAQVSKLASHHEFTTKDVMVKRHKTIILHFLLSFKVDGRMTPRNKFNPITSERERRRRDGGGKRGTKERGERGKERG